MRSRIPLTALRRAGVRGAVVALVAMALVGVTLPASAQSTPNLADARRAADAAAARVQQLQAELGELDSELARLEAEQEAAQAELDRLRDQVQHVAIDRYTRVGTDDAVLLAEDFNEGERARALAEIVTQGDRDALDRYAATKERLARTSKEVEARRGEQEKRLSALEQEQQRMADELERLEQLEAQRLEAERRAAEEAARRNDEAAKQRAAQLASLADARAAGKAGGDAPAVSSGPPRQVASGDWVCPVQGARTFRDSWGDARSGGRAHKGVDIMSPRGTPVVNPVSGVVSTRGDRLGGLSMHVQGDDGNYYYGTHLDSYSGATGHLPAGTVIGYVGDTGNAQGTHLHFEIHIGGYGNPINPYPTVARYC